MKMKQIDLRSDTVSWPTDEMRLAMAKAPVGDDVYGEDPTINRLEALAAERLGKQAALFVASGTMANLVAVLTHAGRGDEAILGYDSHIFQWEAGGMAALGGVMPHPLPNDEMGRLDPLAVEAAVRENDAHRPRTRLLLLENSFGGKAGAALPPSYFASMREIAERHALAIHVDGARLFNAAVAQGLPAADLCADVDSVSFCLSKGLCAPVGSMLCGSREFIGRARRVRKSLGGGMRQAGVLGAAGIVALEKMVDRLTDDHANAAALSRSLSAIRGVRVVAAHTNIVHFELDGGGSARREALVRRLKLEHGILIGHYPPGWLRAVTHYWIGPDEVARAAAAVGRLVAERDGLS